MKLDGKCISCDFFTGTHCALYEERITTEEAYEIGCGDWENEPVDPAEFDDDFNSAWIRFELEAQARELQDLVTEDCHE